MRSFRKKHRNHSVKQIYENRGEKGKLIIRCTICMLIGLLIYAAIFLSVPAANAMTDIVSKVNESDIAEKMTREELEKLVGEESTCTQITYEGKEALMYTWTAMEENKKYNISAICIDDVVERVTKTQAD